MKGVKRSPVSDLNPHLTCKICKGYFIDATTIVECLHTFCRSCIVKYLQTNKYCPVCEVQVHKTKPLLSIKRDKTIQDVVYKLVPRLFHNEMQRRKDFYEKNPETKPSPLEQTVEMQYQHLLAPEESVSLTLKYFGCNGTPRYLKCPAAVSIGHLHKLIRAKYDLSNNHRVEVLINQDTLNPTLTLMDVAYIYFAKKKCPMELSYRIYECTSKNPAKTEDKEPTTTTDTKQNNNTWREVQLRISENGEMSITDIQDDLLKIVEPEVKVKEEEEVKVKKEVPGLKFIGKSADTTTVFTTINTTKCCTKVSDGSNKRKSDDVGCDEAEPKPKQIILNHSITFKNLSVDHPLNRHSLNVNGKSDGSEEPLQRPGTPIPKPKSPCYMPKPAEFRKPPTKSSHPIGYKTLRDPPKSWNSQISRANLITSTSKSSSSSLVNNNKVEEAKKPPKFFKMRNNVPRYLGNPASGVKPMYANPEIKRHSIVKIDPKTLKPISSKAPNDTSLLSSVQKCAEPTKPDLKINTSSVSIFNPLKNHPTLKRDSKPAPPPVSFTPPNPFVPNVSGRPAPAIAPNQFLFPAYDPRLVAAYHTLWFNNAKAILDLNQRKLLPPPANRQHNNKDKSLHSTVEKLVEKIKDKGEKPRSDDKNGDNGNGNRRDV